MTYTEEYEGEYHLEGVLTDEQGRKARIVAHKVKFGMTIREGRSIELAPGFYSHASDTIESGHLTLDKDETGVAYVLSFASEESA